ncbi:hypothetical protein [Hydrogenimonas urashimensis]|uniref:hypothetical protein n=1 Tax=Hydrogenimonas urashimensis TaxID=2740515 RepID=UPI0019165641|nr:hypothetical protein [Hydrogenimonas urashimensis]
MQFSNKEETHELLLSLLENRSDDSALNSSCCKTAPITNNVCDLREVGIQITAELLEAAGYGPMIGKKEYAESVGCSRSAVNNYIMKGYGIPNYKKLGSQHDARIIFALKDVAEDLANQTVKTA